jgi:hypothetical protein
MSVDIWEQHELTIIEENQTLIALFTEDEIKAVYFRCKQTKLLVQMAYL